MKKIYLFVLISVLGLQSCMISTKSNMDFISTKDLKGQNEIVALNIPTLLVKPFVVKALKEDIDGIALLPVIKSIKHIRILTMSLDSTQDNSSYNQRLKTDLKTYLLHNNYEPLISIKKDNQIVTINTVTKKEKVRRMLIAISDENQKVFVTLKSNISPKDLSKLINGLDKD